MRYMFVCIALLLAACVHQNGQPVTQVGDKLTEIKARGTLIIATDPDYAPQSQLLKDMSPALGTKCEPTQYTANQFIGFDVAVAVAVANQLGVEPCFVTPPWSQLVAGNWGDNWDIHAGSMAITLDRMNSLYFSQPYYAPPIVALVHKENTTYQKPEDLSGKRIGVCVGCTFEEYLKGTLKLPGDGVKYRIRDAQIIGYENEDPAIRDLLLGDGAKLDAVLTLLPIANQAIASGQSVKILGEPLFFAYASITVDRSSQRDLTSLMKEIDLAIKDLHQSGILKQMSENYHKQDLTQEAARFDLSSIN
ncbi:MAG: transporter substrate-binding domain-containing protein [Anaerolineales bacterium]|nr:transporter substrate-binding domain-containing protein [Anaerolineales bacterium]